MTRVIKFNKTGYEPFFDYIKAYAIICVLIGHTINTVDQMASGLWVSMQVPLFVLVQSFHTLKKQDAKLNPSKLFWRIILPFLIVQVAIIVVLSGTVGIFDKSLIISGIIGGGYGPGSYFPWVYVQLAVILSFVRPLFEKGAKVRQTIVAILLCELFEILCSITNLPDWFYRLLAVRYLFLIYLAWIWVREGIIMNRKNLILSIISAVTVIYFEYFASNNEPLFYNTAWSYHRWPCYYYVSCLMCFVLYQLYIWMRKSQIIDNAIKLLAKCSYEIFLVQMAACRLLPVDLLYNRYLKTGLWVLAIFIISILGGYLFNRLYAGLLVRVRQNRLCIVR